MWRKESEKQIEKLRRGGTIKRGLETERRSQQKEIRTSRRKAI